MSTRSLIALEGEGQLLVGYCHMDGYPEAPYGVGHRLRLFYTEARDILALLRAGDMSQLGDDLEDCVPMREPSGPVMLDAGDDADKAVVSLGMDWGPAQWAYIFKPGEGWRTLPVEDGDRVVYRHAGWID